MSRIAAYYVMRIQQGKMTLAEVPARWRDEVREALEPVGYEPQHLAP